MPWRLVVFILILGFVVLFAGANITNASDISFGFYTVEDVPIFISLFFAYVVGVLTMVPFTIRTMRRKKRIERSEESVTNREALPGPVTDDEGDAQK